MMGSRMSGQPSCVRGGVGGAGRGSAAGAREHGQQEQGVSWKGGSAGGLGSQGKSQCRVQGHIGGCELRARIDGA